ncbi:type IV conjugative transfer system coupling protein TraD [Candidatus Protochlamydia phocaeensis]|uniref:type IV conjugative transfer system coupling protein TraD n=1 Tax=Candidatus Protochlamydia phocaeensis TaxID=1414722 RepID=UPI0008389D73|nr:type IV conjugative transfer system coupling protein TraD [Candidatus Protochlamydia phocaeensis]
MGVIHTLTEGGQIWAHRVRMFKQVMKIAIIFSCLIWIGLFGYRMSRLPNLIYYASYYHLQANYSLSASVDQIEVDHQIWQVIAHEKQSQRLKVSSKRVFNYTKPYWDQLVLIGHQNLIMTSQITFFAFIGIIFFFFIRGRISKRKEHISGKKVSSAWKIKTLLKLKGQASSIKLGNLPIVRRSETQHILITGGTGSGKTNCFNNILPQIRKNKQRAIIIDTTGVFVERYFRVGKDILLNPCDERSVSWHPWIECRDRLDFDSLAEGFIPQSYSENDEYWRTASRSLLSAALLKLNFQKNTSELTNKLLFEPLSKLAEFVQGTKAAAHIDLNSERTAGSVRSVASSFLGCLEFLQDTESPFSIREWIEKEQNDSWLFLACKPIQRPALNPLIAAWFSVAIRSLMQLKPSLDRRIWFIIDELPSLNKLKDLDILLCESRKYGGCALLALQSPAQLNSIYGPNGAKTILGNCATKIVFAEQDPEVAEQISKIFGDREIKEYQEGLSYGANDVRDGVNLSLQTRNIPLVNTTDIQFLEKNQAYIKLAGNIPIAKINFKIIK